MDARPRISVVTPSLNQGAFLEDCIRSVLDQGYENLEYAVIDGGGSDGSVDIIERYRERLDYSVSEPDQGHADALNKGFARTTGDIMAWLNSDDKYPPWTFATVAEIFARFPAVNWIAGVDSFWNERGALVGVGRRRPINIYDYLTGDYAWIQQESVFWRRTLWERAGGYINPDYRLMVDGELWARFFLHDRLYLVDAVLGGYRRHAANRAQQHEAACHAEMRRAIAAMRERCPPDRLRRARQLRVIRSLSGRRLRLLRLDQVARLLLPRLYDAYRYDCISYENGNWVSNRKALRRRPFAPWV